MMWLRIGWYKPVQNAKEPMERVRKRFLHRLIFLLTKGEEDDTMPLLFRNAKYRESGKV